ncbi:MULTISPECIES: response regulator [Burkholderia]|uniref:Osmolarity response regulator n=1 Tax=Burkholderia paludis TaxID=1506587 RepID=A0A6J5EZN1_9BURK|nr:MULTISPECIES: response regulator [Burkholderia]CAB3771554.1 Transcriptional regulatory protein OmpR [Burkholderia paludis]VWC28348.1 osmolarity response regulator [Burkholderia paludis]
MKFPRPYHLFVVDDDFSQRARLCAYLEKYGLLITQMKTGEEMLLRIHRVRPDLIVLNAVLPNMSGLCACRELRADGDRIPIILLNDHGDDIERVLALETGADDCLSEPYTSRELLARVRAVLRRASSAPGGLWDSNVPIQIGDYEFNVARRSLIRGKDVRILKTVEFSMLAELTVNAGISVSRERLRAVSHGRDQAISLRAVDATVVRLRKLLEPNPGAPRYIQTVRGHGYVFIKNEQKGWHERST